MNRIYSVRHQFVESAPRQLEPGILYVSFKYSSVLHTCCCGCGREVITPLSPAQWSLTYNGQAITLEPSIGNWSFPCRSHYWIRANKVVWGRQFSQERIDAVREQDERALHGFVDGTPRRPKHKKLHLVMNWLKRK